jgi:hypothetical protein
MTKKASTFLRTTLNIRSKKLKSVLKWCAHIYFILTLLVVGGDEKGSLESETVKYGQESHGTWTQKSLRWRWPGAIVNDRPVLSSERAPHIKKPANV